MPPCPKRFVTPDVWEAVDFADSAKRGTWPVAGGRLDQSASFEAAARMIWAEQSHWRRELKLKSREE